jgi:hypothetical protein
MFVSFLENVVNYTKRIIKGFVSLTPYKNKIEENVYMLIEHTAFFVFGSLAFYDREWLYDLSMMWDYNFEWSVYIYYYLYFIRYYIQIKQLDKKTKDYYIMLTHHIMTMSLLAISAYRHVRIGVIIALSHDIVDIFLNYAKIMNKMYEVSKNPRHERLSNLSLSFFLCSWIPTRIILNYKILEEIFNNEHLSFNISSYYENIDVKLAFVLLLINFGLQLFWQLLIFVFVYNIFLGKKSIDEKGHEYKMVN